MDSRAFLSREFIYWAQNVPRDPGIFYCYHVMTSSSYKVLVSANFILEVLPGECPKKLNSMGYNYMKRAAIETIRTYCYSETNIYTVRRYALLEKQWKA